MRLLYIGLFTALLAFQGQAQETSKIGHINLGNFLTSLPEVMVADSLLQTYQVNLLDTLKQKEAALKQNLAIYQSGISNMTMVQAKAKEEELKKEEEALRFFSYQSEQKLQTKRQELLQPVLVKIDEAIKEVGKENGYDMIFDGSIMNALLFAQDAQDVSELVKAKYLLK